MNRAASIQLPPLSSATTTKQLKDNKIKGGADAIYDTLPANGGRANYSLRSFLVEFPDDSGLFTAQEVLRQIIPDGRVFFARQIRVNMLDLADDITGESIGIPQDFVYVTLARNGQIEVFNQKIGLSPLDGFIPVSLWAGPGDVVQVLFTADYSAFASVDFDLLATVEVNLIGDILMTDGKPYPYTGLKE
jgi:hypothetical protein